MSNPSILTADSGASHAGNPLFKLRLVSIAVIATIATIDAYAATESASLKGEDVRASTADTGRAGLHRLNDERLRDVSQDGTEETLRERVEYLQSKLPAIFDTDSGPQFRLPAPSNFIAVINADGSVTLTRTGGIIEQVSLRNIQPNGKTGNTSGPSFGTIELNHIVFRHTIVTISSH